MKVSPINTLWSVKIGHVLVGFGFECFLSLSFVSVKQLLGLVCSFG
jgi:hypothetical protein